MFEKAEEDLPEHQHHEGATISATEGFIFLNPVPAT
jgi:hypothetical protein